MSQCFLHAGNACILQSPFILASLQLLAALVALLPPNAATAAQDNAVQILPVNFLRLGEVALVEDITDNFYPDRPNRRDGRWRKERWSSLLRRKMHPNLLNDIIKSYESNGLKNPPEGYSYEDRDFFSDFFRECFPWKTKMPWDDSALTEFEKVRAMRAFYDKHREDIEGYNVELPMTLGAIQEIRLDDYDRAQQRFKIARQQASKFATGNRYPLRYRFVQPRESLLYLPMPPDEAELLLAKLDGRKLHLLETHRLVKLEQHPEVTSGVVGVMEDQQFTVFIPGQYKVPVHTQKTSSLDELASADQDSPTKNQGASNDQLHQKMQKICKELKLLNMGGLPISGTLPSGLLTDAQKKSFNDSQERLADRILLGLMPDLLSPEIEVSYGRSRRNEDSRRSNMPRDFELLSRVLGKATVARYCVPHESRWLGDDIFTQKESLERFLKEQEPVLRKLAIKPPLRFRTIDHGEVGVYDFKTEQLPIAWYLSNRVTGMRTDFGLNFPQSRSFRDNPALNVTSPIAYPTYWKLPPDEARKKYQSLKSIRPNLKSIYVSTIFDVTQSPQEVPAFIGRVGARYHTDGVLITPVSAAVYSDPACRNVIWETPLIVPTHSVLQSAKPNLNKEELYLWQPEIQIALLDQFDSSLVRPSDLVVAATSVAQEDAEYYEKGTVLSHRIQGLDRNNLLSQHYNSKRDQGWLQFWDSDYQPFFPGRFFGIGNDGLTQNPELRLGNEHLDKLRTWLQQRVEAQAGEFRLEGTIIVDRKAGTAELKPGDSNSRSAPISSSLANVDEIGHVSMLTFPDDSRRRRYDSDDSTTDFSVVFPAMRNRLQFSVNPETLPVFHQQNNDDRFKGDLVVQVDKIQHVNDSRLGPQALIHIRPVRFEILGSTDPEQPQDERLQLAGQTALTLPVDIPNYTRADQIREAEEKQRQQELEDERRRKQEAAEEMARQQKREQEAQKRREEAVRAQEERDREQAEQRQKYEQRLQKEEEQAARDSERREQEMQRQLKDDEELQKQYRMEEAERTRINDQCNQLLTDGYQYEDIDWNTGELLPGRGHSLLGTLFRWMLTLGLLGGASFLGWRFMKTNASDS